MSSSVPAAGKKGWDVQIDGRYVVYTRREHGSGLSMLAICATAEHTRAHAWVSKLGCDAYAQLIEQVTDKLVAVTLGRPGNRYTLYHPGRFTVDRFAVREAGDEEKVSYKTLVRGLELPVGNCEPIQDGLYPLRRVLVGPGRLQRQFPDRPLRIKKRVLQDSVVAGPWLLEGVLYERGHNDGPNARQKLLDDDAEEFMPNPRNPLQFMSPRATEMIDAFIERRQSGDESEMHEGEESNVAMKGHLSELFGGIEFGGHAWQIGDPLEDMLVKHSPPRNVEWGYRIEIAGEELATVLEFTLDWEQALREPTLPQKRGSLRSPHVLRRGGTKRGKSSRGQAASSRGRRGGQAHGATGGASEA